MLTGLAGCTFCSLTMSSADKRRRRGVAKDESELWRRVVADAKPLKSRARPSAAKASAAGVFPDPPQPQEVTAKAPAARPAPATPAGAKAATAQWPPALDHGFAPGLDRRSLARLRKGLVPIEGELDLHGLRYEDAQRALEDYLQSAQQRGLRCVLIITGKGRRSEEAAGVLRTAVPRWLNQPPSRERVLGFCYAVPPHGGEGALYVLLRRRKARPTLSR